MTTQPIPSTTDDLIAEIEAEAKALEWTGKWYNAGCGTVHCDYKGQFTDDGHGEVAHPEPIGAASYIASASPANVLTLIARIRELEDVLRMYSLPIGGDLNRDCAEFGGDAVHRELMRRTVLDGSKVAPP